MMPKRRPSLVHDLSLALRIEVLRDLAHDAGQFALPGFELRRVFLDEIQQVFLGACREHRLGRRGLCGVRHDAVVFGLAHRLLRHRPDASPARRAPCAYRACAAACTYRVPDRAARAAHRASVRHARRHSAPRNRRCSCARTACSRAPRRAGSTAGRDNCPWRSCCGRNRHAESPAPAWPANCLPSERRCTDWC